MTGKTSYPLNKISIILIALIGLIYLSLETNPFYELLYFENTKILKGEVWRIFTAHITHNNLDHLLVNLAAFVIIFILFDNKLTTYNWFIFFIFSTLFIACCYLILDAKEANFVGSSSLAYATFSVMGLSNYSTNRFFSAISLSFIVVVVICQQLITEFSLLSILSETDLATQSHLYGMISGFIYFALLSAIKIRSKQTASS